MKGQGPKYVMFATLTVVTMKSTIFCDMMCTTQ
jgi:hypothetical protein